MAKTLEQVVEMMNESNKTKNKETTSKIITTGLGILTVSVLAYCGYKIVKNQLQKTEYEPDPNKKIV